MIIIYIVKIVMIIIVITRVVTREEGLPEELVALMEDMKSAQKKANPVTLKFINDDKLGFNQDCIPPNILRKSVLCFI